MVNSTILIIEDNSMLVAMLHVFAKLQGLHALFASSGKEGLLLAETCQPGLIICDYHLDDMTADTFYTVVKSNPKLATIPILLMTGIPLTHTLRKQFDACIEKPFEINDLLKLLSSIVV